MKDLIKRIEMLEINPRYDAAQKDILQIRDSSNDRLKIMYRSFMYGYWQGQKATQAELKRRVLEPKSKDEHRRAITWNALNTKNICTLQDMLTVTDLFRRKTHDIEYATLTDAEYQKTNLIQAALACNDAKTVENICTLVEYSVYQN